ncbi:MAG TPA: polysaccharide deacetylase family protein [Polyangia bacterium]|jgi:peptidoglycan/xylan/chitin deacetylase (PgdA/CDA1 family)|nr:polysaccharide deacetylase family protein [Polyangia bacterium]
MKPSDSFQGMGAMSGVSTNSPLASKVRRAGASLLPASVLVRRGTTKKKRLALTFDDGPDEMTPQYLSLLDRLGIRVTFFLVGKNCHERRSMVLDIVARGHEVAGHGYTHRRFTRMAPHELRDELTNTTALLPPPRTRRPLVRPPHGSTSLQSLLRCTRAGYTTVLWSADSGDAHLKNADEVALQLTPDRVVSGDIVLLHEGQRWTLDALPRIVRGLQGAGFELVTVGEVLAP